ncbi:hypothetical protein L3X38_006725 [Prunus dulcis]|uniref:RNase H type-1 domain-containing protein n=1 Tax=Prunus dulcis TaxID=3755 RepID=A0AAD4ZTC3_PRUDU|nr:hypothetical protein L3X38_006725 [Prunus dulcis]
MRYGTNTPNGYVKLNYDGAWLQQTMKGGIGWAIRDRVKWMLKTGGAGSLLCQSALMTEVEAIRDALTNVLNADFDQAIVESDSHQLI